MVAPGSAERARPRGRPCRRQDTAERARSPGRGRGDIAGLLLEQPRAALLPQAVAVPADRDDLHRVAAVRPAGRVRLHAVDLDRRDAPALAAQVDVLADERRAVGGPEALGVQPRRDLAIHQACGVQLADAPLQPCRLRVLAVARHAAPHLVLARGAGLPGDPQPDQAALALLVQGALAHDQAQHALALLGRGAPPNPRQVPGQAEDLGALRLARRAGLLGAPGRVGLLDGLGLAQLLLPGPLQGARHQTVLRLDRTVLPPRPPGLVARPPALEAPLVVQGPRCRLQLAHGRHRQRDLVGGEGVQQHALELGIDAQRPHLLAARRAGEGLVGGAVVDGVVAVGAGVVHAHAPPASAARGDALQQRAALARHAGPPLRVAGDVAGEPGLVGHELLPADVARVGVAQAHRPPLDGDLDRRTPSLAGAAARRVLAALSPAFN